MHIVTRLLTVLLLASLTANSAIADEPTFQECVAAYRAAFEAGFPKVRTIEEGRALVTPAKYDEIMLEQRLPGLLGMDPAADPKEAWSKAYDYLKLDQSTVTNENSAMAWGLSYDHLSLNQMARATGDPKYILASWQLARAIADARDSARGLKLYTGETAPAWGCSKYLEEGQRAVHAVHTGVIAFPVLEVLQLLRTAPDFENKPSAEEQAEVLKAMQAALEYHDRQFEQGPADGEGYYIGMNQEPALNGVALPANRQAAMGRALLIAWQLTGNDAYHDKVVRIGRYLKNRFSLATDKNAYTWAYSLLPDDKPQSMPLLELAEDGLHGEDISHGSLTASFPLLLHRAGEVFDAQDAERFANTLTEIFGREGDGVLYTNVDGMPQKEASPGLLVLPGRWLRIASDDPESYAILEEFLLTRDPVLRPLDLANLILYRPKTPAEK
ncbi:MAG: hypothetical protein IT368_07050 [Candidatus Hydrogenedentes bacterium]|nr:hypothetical protein [Candidatus Hydrogenedentota bacterium]